MRRLYSILPVCVMAMTLSACSITSITDRLVNEEKLSKQLHASPRFVYDTMPADGYDNLSILSNEFFMGKPYNNIMSFGDNILLIGQGIYGLDEDFEGDEDINTKYRYSFDVYDPWRNQIIASLDYEDVECDHYQIVGDRLFLINYDKLTMDEYDLKLQFIASHSYKELDEISSAIIYPGSDNHYYTQNYQNNDLIRIDPDTFNLEGFTVDMYDPVIATTSSDGQYMLLSGVNERTLRYEMRAVDTSDFSTLFSRNGEIYSSAAVSDHAIISEYNQEQSEWVIDYFNSESIYFSMDNVRDVKLLPDGTALIHQESYYDEDESDEHYANFYQIDKYGKCISDFSYSCPVTASGEYTYLSSDYVYLEACNSVMILAYTNEVTPYIIVWDLDAPHKTTTDFVSSTTPLSANSTNTDEHNWGELSEANAKATVLENKFGIEIYLGPEVPESIDVFSCKQNRDPSEVMDALNALEKLLLCYPDNFFVQLTYGNLEGIRIYLAGDLAGGSEGTIEDPSAFVTSLDSHLVMVLDSNYSYDWNYTFNHEISHMVDRRLDFLANYRDDLIYSEEKWNSFNPDGFTYLDSYQDYEDCENYNNNQDYFINSYGTTYATEDRAEIFGSAMEDYLNTFSTDGLFIETSPLYSKLKFYCECIRDGFDTTGWDDVLPWETLISE